MKITASNPASLLIHGSVFVNNWRKDGKGGAIYINRVALRMNDSKLTNNTAAFGGAIWASSSDNPVMITTTTFVGNSATISGGGSLSPPLICTDTPLSVPQ